MKRNKNGFLLSLSLLSLIVLCVTTCNNKKQVVLDDLKVYKVEKIEDVFLWDDFVEKVDVIPLETNPSSLIGTFYKGIVLEDDVFVLDRRYHTLINFDIGGNFKKKIGERGNGPDEYVEIRDFCVAGNDVYVLDYKKIHQYSKITGKKENTWSFNDFRGGFNPNNMFVFDKDVYFVWRSNPDVQNPEDDECYRMHKMQEGKIKESFFRYTYPLTDDSRFFMLNEQSCYLRPIDGEDVVYKLTRDSLNAVFKIDFGSMAITAAEIIELRKNAQRDAYLASNKFKSISIVLEIKDYIFFRCTGPDKCRYEGLISKQTGNVKFGISTGTSPDFFFSDGTFLYGYYEPFIIDLHRNKNARSCFDSVWLNSENIKLDDNIVLVKVKLK